MKNHIILLLILSCTYIFSQQKIKTNPWVNFSKDSLVNKKLTNSLENFLEFSNKGNFSNKYINKHHLENNTYIFDELENVFISNYYKDSLFYKPLLLKSFSLNDSDYQISISFTGFDNKTNTSITTKIITLIAKPKDDYYQFFSIYKENLKKFNVKNVNGIKFYYKGIFNKKEASKMVKFTKKLENLTDKKSPLINYIKCSNTNEANSLFGLMYNLRSATSDLGFGYSDEYGNFITGVNSEAYIHDYIHAFFGKHYKSNKTWREFEEGIAIYYGGNWELSFLEVKNVLIEELSNNRDFDFLSELKKGRKSKRYKYKHLYDRLICSILVEYCIEKRDFKTVLDILHCGNNGENLFLKLEKHLNINETNFNNKFITILKN